MSKGKKFSLDTDLAVQVDKLSKELEESKAREEQLSKLADGMIQVISNYQLEVSRKDAEIEDMRKKLDEYKLRKQISKSTENAARAQTRPEVTSSGLSATVSKVTRDEKATESAEDSKLEECRQKIQLVALSDKTILSLLGNGNLPLPLQTKLGWFTGRTRLNMPSEYIEIILWLKDQLRPVKQWLITDFQKRDQLNRFEKDVLDIVASVFGEDPIAPEVDSAVEPPPKKVKIAATVVGEKYVSDSLLKEMSSIVNLDQTFTKLQKPGTSLPKNVLDAIDWLRNPTKYKETPNHLPEHMIGAICRQFFILMNYCEKGDRKKLSSCRDKVVAYVREALPRER
ncbi:hypothetical protein HDE_12242 [Halotydeus destructor]|nr:hypothetical protein HDE_12242 [Halotydeus destructor]